MFGIGKKKDSNVVSVAKATQEPTQSTTIDLTKKQETLNLRKKTLVISLEKKNINGVKARVVSVMDRSGSMQGLFKDGTVQDTMERIFPLALKFDDDGELDSYIFETGFTPLEPVTLNNYYNYQETVMDSHEWGLTNYAPVMKDIVERYSKYTDMPTYVLFFTDGDNGNNDKRETTELMKEISGFPIFWQFVGLGTANMDYLEKLDDMPGRTVDNADFFRIKNVGEVTDEWLYNKLLDEFPGWLNTVKSMGMIN